MKVLSGISFLLALRVAIAQPVVKEYYDRVGERCDEKVSYFYSVGYQTKAGYFYDSVKSYYTATHTLRSVEVRDNRGAAITATFYYQSGRLKMKTYCDRLRRKGAAMDTIDYSILEFRDTLGHVMVQHGQGFVKGRVEVMMEEGRVLNGRRDSLWTYFYDDGKVYSYESWQTGKFIDGISYDRDGREFYYQQLSSLPFLVGGPAQLYSRMNGNINYPKRAQQKSIEGKVVLEFMVEKDGTVSSPKVLQGIGFGCDEEAIKVMLASPRWVPAKIKGQPVRYKMTLPILFKLS
jgi:TonB family protein